MLQLILVVFALMKAFAGQHRPMTWESNGHCANAAGILFLSRSALWQIHSHAQQRQESADICQR